MDCSLLHGSHIATEMMIAAATPEIIHFHTENLAGLGWGDGFGAGVGLGPGAD